MRSRMPFSTIWVIVLLVGGYVALVFILFFFQSHLLYLPNVPSRDVVVTPDDAGLAYESVTIATGDGVTLDGWFVPARQARGVLLFFHGNAGNISHRLDSLKIFNELAFTSIPDLAAALYPFLPARSLARFRYSTQAALVSVLCPLLIVHSRDDEIIPFTHGQRLFAVANEPKRLRELRGGHNDGFLVSRHAYMDGLHAFLEPHLRPLSP